MTHETTAMAMVPYEHANALSIVSPLVDPEAARQAMLQYEALKAAIVQPTDIFREVDKKGNVHEFLKKKFWRRLATFFGLSLKLVSEERGFDEHGALFYRVIAQAIAPNGRTMDADGYCSMAERGKDWWSEHNIRATAVTRAKNRAISDLVGGGEVSAEELLDDDEAPAMRQLNAGNARSTKQSPISDIDRAEMKRLCEALGRVYDESKVEGHEHAMKIQRALQKELDERTAKEAAEAEAQEPEQTEEVQEADGDGDEETITYSVDDEPAYAPESTPAPEWHPLEDPKFINSLREIKIVNVADQEAFVAAARKHYPNEALREACKLEYAQRFNAQQKAKGAPATRGRGPHALAATSTEPVPDSLESLPTGRRAS